MQRLPEQYFAGILAAVAAERARPGPRGDRPRPRQPRPAAARRTRWRRARRGDRRPGAARLRAVPGRAGAARGDRRALRGRPRRDARPRPRGRGRARRQDGDHAASRCACAGPRRHGRCCPTPATRTTCRRVALAGARGAALPLDARHGWQPDWDAAGREPTRRCWWSTTRRTRCAACAAPGTFEAAVAFARERGGLAAQRPRLRVPGLRRPPRAQRAGGRRRARRARWSCGRRRRSTGWPAGGWASPSATPSWWRASRRCSTTSPRACSTAAAARPGGRAARRPAPTWRERRAVYERRRDLLVARCAAGVAARREGTFYAWWRLPDGLTAPSCCRAARVGGGARRGLRRARRGLGAAVARGARRGPARGGD